MNRLACLAVVLTLPACASIVEGSTQSLSVATTPRSGAECRLVNDAGTWYVGRTPGSVSVKRSASAIKVACSLDKQTGTAVAESRTKGLAWGNVLAGGIIGGAVDMSTGAAYDYPPEIVVPLKAE
ncbi:MAG: hypothetical protein R3D33_17920 [Hyphomicrobiaceae bacterium]